MEKGRSAFKILKANLKERDLKEDLGINGRSILEWILKKYCHNWIDMAQERGY